MPLDENSQWWRRAVVYQIYPRSFADADGDGTGDVLGMIGRLEYLASLGVDAIWVSPWFPSPLADGGYDVSDYRGILPEFGTLEQADEFVTRAHDLGLRVLIDLVPNHSSDEHPWFQQALAAVPGSPERARYLFRDGRGPGGDLAPNNWKAIFGGPAWDRVAEADGTPGQWYLHLFDPKQPDWDWTNPEIRAEFVDILRFWLDRGVDGFRVDVAHSLVKAGGLPDAEPADGPDAAFGSPDGGAIVAAADDPGPMWDQDGVHEIYRSWRSVLDGYSPARILVAEAWVNPLSRLARYVRPDEMHQAFNFEFLSCPWDAALIRPVIEASLAANDRVGAPTTWVLSNHDVVRHPSRFGLPDQSRDAAHPGGIGVEDEQPDAELGAARGRAASLSMLALPGSAYLYQGEELGLPEHTALDDDLRQDPTWLRSGYTARGRDGCRVPLPWEADRPGLGFGPGGSTWLPQPDMYRELARDRQVGNPTSTLEMYRSALGLRRRHRLGASSTVDWLELGDDVIAFRNGPVTSVCNMGAGPVGLPAGRVLLASGGLPADRTLPPNTTAWLF